MSFALRALVAAAMLLCIVPAAAQGQTRRPNILLIVADDLGYADIGAYGSRDIPTPNIDRLAASGVRFTDGYVSGPYCSPTRAGLMTGRYPQRFGYEFNPDGSPDYGLPLTERTLAERLRAAGYRTALFGKWHLGYSDRLRPLRRGFEEFYGFLGAEHSYMHVADTDPGTGLADPLVDGTKPAASVTYLTDALGDRAVDYIRRHASEPFFLYLAFNAAHTPLEAPERYLARVSRVADPRRRTYAAMLSAMDDAIGRTLAALRDTGLEEETLVIFLNDNGGPTMPTTTENGSSNAPLRGSKRQTWEGGIRVAFVIAWKGRLDAGRVDRRPIIQLDVLPTALSAAGIAVEKGEFDGVDLLPFLTGAMKGEPHAALYWRLGGMMAVRSGHWKLVKTREGPFVDVDPSVLRDLSSAGLYNLADDIGEARDLAADRPDKAKELADLWQKWNREMARPAWTPRLAGRPDGGEAIRRETSGSFVFNDPGSHHPITVWFCRPPSLAADTRIVFVMHGSESQTARQACQIAASDVQALNALVLAPQFSEEHYPDDAYMFGDMLDDSHEIRPKAQWALVVIERLFDAVRHDLASSRSDYDIVGFSGGGQFVHRLVLFVPEARYRRAVAASPARYAFPTWSEPFPYGLAGSPTDRGGLARALSRDFILMLGDADLDDREREREATTQGTNRFARGLRFFATASEQAVSMGVPIRWRLHIVHGVDHSAVPMIKAALQMLRD